MLYQEIRNYKILIDNKYFKVLNIFKFYLYDFVRQEGARCRTKFYKHNCSFKIVLILIRLFILQCTIDDVLYTRVYWRWYAS